MHFFLTHRPTVLAAQKVCLTDGAQAVCGIERRPIAALRAAVPGAAAAASLW